jgi:hypothetical protein
MDAIIQRIYGAAMTEPIITMLNLQVVNPESPQANKILQEILPMVLNRFVRKNNDYTVNGRNVSENFGIKGQFMKMYDKIAKLRRPLWEDGELTGDEAAEEILEDLVGHALLTLYFLRESKPKTMAEIQMEKMGLDHFPTHEETKAWLEENHKNER